MADEKRTDQPTAAEAPLRRPATGPEGTPPRDFAFSSAPVRPDLVCRHDSVGGVYSKGDVIPQGAYSEEQEARLVDIGAAEWVVPAGVPKNMVTEMPTSTAEYQAAERARSVAAAGGSPDDVKAARADVRKAKD